MTPAIALAERQQLDYRLHSFVHEAQASSFGMEAAQKLGVDAARILKTLIASTEAQTLLVALLPVDCQLDLKRLARASGYKKVQLATAKQAERSSGYVLGGISPLAQKQPLPTLIEQRVQAHTSVLVSAGKRGLEMELALHDLAKLTDARFAALIATPTQPQ